MHRIATTRRAFLGSAASAFFLAPAAAAWAADWPMYRNASHDGHSDEKIAKEWPKDGPKVLWKVPMGLGFSAVSVAGKNAFVNGEKDGQECCFCLDANSGKTNWVHPFDKAITDRQGGDGPRSTPTVDGDHVYLLGTYLKLICLTTDGKPVWQVDLQKQYGAKVPGWGGAASAVLDGDAIFVNTGGGKGRSLLAFDKSTGKQLWATQDDGLVHSSPTVATIAGQRQVVYLTATGVVACKPEDGTVLWRYAFPHKTSTAASPIVGDDMVFVSAAYGVGAGCCKITKSGDTFTAQELWRTPGKLQNHWTTPVFYDGHLYGLFKEPAALRCIEMATGKEKWAGLAGKEIWRGATIFVDGCVLVQGNEGDLYLVEATPEKFNQLAHCKSLSGKCWTMPTVANGRIYARSDHEVVCLQAAALTA